MMRVTDKVFALEATAGCTAYAVQTAKGFTLIDSGLPRHAEGIIRELTGAGYAPGDLRQILLTHHDVDHIGSAAALQRWSGCRVYITQEDLPYANGSVPRPAPKDESARRENLEVPELTVYPDGGIEGFTLVPTPGHTPGHLCIVFENVLFAGDQCMTRGGAFTGPNPIYTADMPLALESLEKMKTLRFDWLCPAHGAPFGRHQLDF